MRQETQPDVEAMNHFFGKLTDGELNCRGIALRRRDCPLFLKKFQKKLIEILFDAERCEEVAEKRLSEARTFANTMYSQVRSGNVDVTELAISKHVRKELSAYRSMFPHVIAAKELARRGKRLDEYASVDFIFTNAVHSNPLRRVIPSSISGDGDNHYDRQAYGKLLLDVTDTILKPLEKKSSLQEQELLEWFCAQHEDRPQNSA